jgi:hypothetical protein
MSISKQILTKAGKQSIRCPSLTSVEEFGDGLLFK